MLVSVLEVHELLVMAPESPQIEGGSRWGEHQACGRIGIENKSCARDGLDPLTKLGWGMDEIILTMI